MEECSDKNNVNLASPDPDNLNYKDIFDRDLIEYDKQHQGSHRKAWTSKRIFEVINDIKKAQVTMSSGQRRTSMDYYWMSKYEVMTIADEECLVFKRTSATASVVRILPREQYFNILIDVHKSRNHGGRDKILNDLKNRYYIPKKAVEIFVSLCPICATRRTNGPRKSVMTKPAASGDVILRGQVDIMDFQSCPDGEYKWLLIYQDDATKFINLRPLKTKTVVDVAYELMHIFLIFGPPKNLQSNINCEFITNVIKKLVIMWPECNIVYSLRRHRTQGSVERSNQDIKNMLEAWINEKKSTNWSVGCAFVQYLKNTSIPRATGKSPFKALFGHEPKAGLNRLNILSCTLLPATVLPLRTEDKLIPFTERKSAEATSIDCENAIKVEIEVTENYDSNFTCGVCHNDTTGALKCEHCNSVANEICDQVDRDVNIERDNAHNMEHLESNFTCTVCHKATTGALKCEQCNNVANVIYGIEQDVNAERDDKQNIENLELNFICTVCHNDTTGAVKCEHCYSVVNAICRQRQHNINIERDKVHKGVKRKAEKMIDAIGLEDT